MRNFESIVKIILIAMLVLMIMFLTGCYLDKKVTVETALERSKYLKVKCKAVRTDGIEPTINIVGKEIEMFCGDYDACYHPDTYKIYSRHNDGWLINHELSHHYCKTGKHIKGKKKIKSSVWGESKAK